MRAAGCDLVIGLWDAYPFIPVGGAPAQLAALARRMPESYIRLHIAVMEIETWFLEDSAHFLRISPKIDTACLNSHIGQKASVEDYETIPEPAALMKRIYATAKKSYSKSKTGRQQTIAALDYARMYLSKDQFSGSLQSFIATLEYVFDRRSAFNVAQS